MRLLSFFLIFFSVLLSFAQERNDLSAAHTNSYVKYASYKAMLKSDRFTVDSIGFFIDKNKDTLIRVSGNNFTKGVRVAYEEKDSVFLNRYKALVFNATHGNANDVKNARMRYWKDEIKVYFDSTVPSKTVREMKKVFKLLDKEVDSLKIKTVNRRDQSNYFIYFVNRPDAIDWDKRITGKSDGGYLSWNGKQQIYNTSIKINSQMIFNEEEQLMTLKKHFIWSLGFFYIQPNQECESFFSSCVYVDKVLTEEDLALIKYHYSYGICKGTDIETFEEQHKSAQKSKRANSKNEHYFIHYN